MHYRSVVHLQVLAAVATLAAAFAWALQSTPVLLPEARVDAVAAQAQWLAIPLLVAVFLVMLKRGRSEDLIQGAASAGTPGILGSLLTNTLEQTVLAVLALSAFVVVSPPDLGAVVQVFVALFCAGRLLFFAGYAANPLWRFYGFSLNFYASVFLLALAWWFSLRGP